MRRGLAGLTLAVFLASLVAACGSSSDGTKHSAIARTVAVKITDAGCEPAAFELPAGAATFEVRNDGANKVSEFELLDGDSVLGEAENIAPSLSGKFSLTLRPGAYITYCPGGTTTERGKLIVIGAASGRASEAATAAVVTYRRYLEGQTEELVVATTRFVLAVKAGNVAKAKALYGPARAPYERIEPLAESFGGLDPAVDARAGDVPKASWTGFHPLEQALWVRGSVAGGGALADRLLRDVKDLRVRVRSVQLEPAQIANGSVELLGEVSKSKITGEEERYSHIDLVDFKANVDGARAAFQAVRPIVAARNGALARTIDGRFDDVAVALAKYRAGNGFVSYRTLTALDTRTLSQAIDALAEPLSKVGALVVARA
jgi:iron uptake system component EfeO